MQHIKKYINIGALSLGLALPGMALSSSTLQSSYIGVNAGIKRHGFVTGYGDTLFKNKQVIINIFAGFKIIPHLDLEINAEKSMPCKKQATLSSNDSILGLKEPIGATATFKSKVNISSIGADLIFKFNPVCCEKFNPLLGIGIKVTKVGLKTTVLNSGISIKLTEGNVKSLAKLLGGWEYVFNNNYGIRGLIIWENTCALKLTGADMEGNRYTAKFKNSTNYTLGIFYKL